MTIRSSLTLFAAVLAGCGSKQTTTPPPPPPPTKAFILANARFAVATPARCNDLDETFQLDPVSPTEGDPVSGRVHGTGAFPEQEGTRSFCVYRNLAMGPTLAPGQWKIELAGFGACTLRLKAGGNGVYFSSATTGCSTTGFP